MILVPSVVESVSIHRRTTCTVYNSKRMLPKIDSELRRALTDRIRYYNDLGIYDFYRRPIQVLGEGSASVARAPSPAISESEGRQTLMEVRTEPESSDHASR